MSLSVGACVGDQVGVDALEVDVVGVKGSHAGLLGKLKQLVVPGVEHVAPTCCSSGAWACAGRKPFACIVWTRAHADPA